MTITMRASHALSAALLCMLAAGCSPATDAQPATDAAEASEADAGKTFIGRQAARAIAKASQALKSKNLGLGDDFAITINGRDYGGGHGSEGLPKAELTPDGELLIEGKVSAEFSGVCARCGCDMVFEIAEPLCFSVEISDEIAEVDLTSELRDAILLALPNHPVCKTDCQGVCPTCGKPLSEGSCTCSGIKNTSPWDTLNELG